jgi:hypothetical protein
MPGSANSLWGKLRPAPHEPSLVSRFAPEVELLAEKLETRIRDRMKKFLPTSNGMLPGRTRARRCSGLPPEAHTR